MISRTIGRVIFNDPDAGDLRHLTEALRDETVGGVLMLAATVAAIVWASVSPHGYEHTMHHRLGHFTLHGWAADGLLTVFFLVAGLELKREFTEGSLRRPVDAMVPILAAVGGMATPALIYLVFAWSGHTATAGWAIPMATDIAFALAVLAIVGRDLPASLRAFLLTLAIVDDLGAIIVIAAVFTAHVAWAWLAASLAVVAVFWLLQRRHVDHPLLGLCFGLAAWFCMLQSGVHATIAGVLMGLCVLGDPDRDDDPLNRWQHALEPWSAGLVVPLFALVSAGVPMRWSALVDVFTGTLTLGIVLGLVVGKTVGISLASFATARFTRAELASGIRPLDVVAVAQVSGIGFTVALLMSDLAFADDPAAAQSAKTAVLVASLLAALLGALALHLRGRRHASASPSPATSADHKH